MPRAPIRKLRATYLRRIPLGSNRRRRELLVGTIHRKPKLLARFFIRVAPRLCCHSDPPVPRRAQLQGEKFCHRRHNAYRLSRRSRLFSHRLLRLSDVGCLSEPVRSRFPAVRQTSCGRHHRRDGLRGMVVDGPQQSVFQGLCRKKVVDKCRSVRLRGHGFRIAKCPVEFFPPVSGKADTWST